MASKEHLIEHWISSGVVKDKRIIESFKKVPRENFIRKEHLDEAYGDYPLAIGEGQTISQPTTVMIMTQALELRKGYRVMEIGAGSGYQAAIIARIIGDKGKVYALELIPQLARLARKNLRKTRIKNVEVICTDGSKGYSKEAPYDRIIITAAAPKTPKHLLSQLKKGGILVAPVGPLYGQEMIKIKKFDDKGKKLKIENLGDFIFVPLKGKKGFKI